ncbi:hypothetical protein ElP_54600 [Tautonia plasticadhaerens]|uniref:Uncharacterized protein n=1 Tax=Tautonia plasticadhaerens TaxID=2527974 RepID=A0A518H9J6_9BACT|nr:hypothetical protein ElP_54600 [Tautonia plasticadhaerens]
MKLVWNERSPGYYRSGRGSHGDYAIAQQEDGTWRLSRLSSLNSTTGRPAQGLAALSVLMIGQFPSAEEAMRYAEDHREEIEEIPLPPIYF